MKSIFFDLDGTLSDPKVGITKSIQYALERLDVPVPTTKKLLWCIGPPLRASFEHLLDEARADKAVALYRERFGDVGLFENDLYDGIPATLDALQNSGIRLFVATSKPHFYADVSLNILELLSILSGSSDRKWMARGPTSRVFWPTRSLKPA